MDREPEIDLTDIELIEFYLPPVCENASPERPHVLDVSATEYWNCHCEVLALCSACVAHAWRVAHEWVIRGMVPKCRFCQNAIDPLGSFNYLGKVKPPPV